MATITAAALYRRGEVVHAWHVVNCLFQDIHQQPAVALAPEHEHVVLNFLMQGDRPDIACPQPVSLLRLPLMVQICRWMQARFSRPN